MRSGVYVDGVRQVQSIFRKLPDKVSNMVTLKAINAAGGEFKRAAEDKVRAKNLVLTGALEKSMRVRVARKRYRDRRVAVVGPRSRVEFFKPGKTKKLVSARLSALERDMAQAAWKARHVTDYTRINPAKYAHLVEFGHGGPRPAPPHPFMRPAFAAKVNAAKRAFTKQFTIGLYREAKKMKKR